MAFGIVIESVLFETRSAVMFFIQFSAVSHVVFKTSNHQTEFNINTVTLDTHQTAVI